MKKDCQLYLKHLICQDRLILIKLNIKKVINLGAKINYLIEDNLICLILMLLMVLNLSYFNHNRKPIKYRLHKK